MKNESDRSRPSGIHTIKHDKKIEAPTETTYEAIPSGTTDRRESEQIIHDVVMPMRDGIELAADIYLPEKEGSFPVILTRMPYGKKEPYCDMPLIGEFWTKKGYAF
ncbi:MAG: hypothetical protein K9L30_17670 [Desulfobacterales bacterium]|nr:hypothetical protein [Desulfobacterales bacterium]